MAAARLAASMGSGGSIGEGGELWRTVKGAFMKCGGCSRRKSGS